MFSDQRLLVVSAHSADWVWRSSGTHCQISGRRRPGICGLPYLRRARESGPLWKQEGQDAENVKKIRLTESMNAAKVLGVTNFEMWDYDDCMLEVSPEIIRKLNERSAKYSPP